MKDNSCGTEDEPLFDFFAVAVFTEVERRIEAQAGFPEQGMLGLPFRVFDTVHRFLGNYKVARNYDCHRVLADCVGDSPDAGPFPAQFGKFGVAQQPRRVRTVFGMRQIEQMFPDRLLKRRSEKPHILPLHRLGHFKNFFRGLFRTRYFRYGIRRHP